MLTDVGQVTQCGQLKCQAPFHASGICPQYEWFLSLNGFVLLLVNFSAEHTGPPTGPLFRAVALRALAFPLGSGAEV